MEPTTDYQEQTQPHDDEHDDTNNATAVQGLSVGKGPQHEQQEKQSFTSRTYHDNSNVEVSLAKQPHPTHNKHGYKRWPSYALDLHPPNNNNNDSHMERSQTNFLFGDQIDTESVNFHTDSDSSQHHNLNNGSETTVTSNHTNGKKPINILKLPWQHPFRNHESNRNPYKIPRALFAALLITTTLALCSAWDAQNHCISNETDALLALLGSQNDAEENNEENNNNNNDNNHNSQEDMANMEDDMYSELSAQQVLAVKTTCRQNFHLLLRVGLATIFGALLALGILRQHQRSFGHIKNTTKEDVDTRNKDGSKRCKRHKVNANPLSAHNPPCFYSFYLPLLFVSGLILAAWTVGIILVMLGPRRPNENTNNPYFSLAAVDAMGRVADNANLYYMSWFSEGICILIFYQLFGAFVRQHWLPSRNHTSSTAINLKQPPGSTTTTASSIQMWNNTSGTPSTATSPDQRPRLLSKQSSMENSILLSPQHSTQLVLPLSGAAGQYQHQHPHQYHSMANMTRHYHSSRIKWYQTFYQLRVRTGMWVAALLCALVVVASSAHLFHEVLLPVAKSLFDDDDYYQLDERHDWWNVFEEDRVCVVLAEQDSDLSEELCERTFFSLFSGVVAAILSFVAIVLHFLTRRSAAADLMYYEACAIGGAYYQDLAQLQNWIETTQHQHHHLPLRSEMLLSVVLSAWLGWNALWVSGVQGPAAKVGNLYYASWLCFLLCLRICLGCVEEFFDIHDDELSQRDDQSQASSLKPKDTQQQRTSYKAPDLATVDDQSGSYDAKSNKDEDDGIERIDKNKPSKDAVEKERAKRGRRYFFLSAFSAVCAGSAYDAAKNQDFELTMSEKYLMLAPTAVSILSAVLFLLCLSNVTYQVVNRVWCGGILSLLTFWVFLGDLVLTMHSDESWAVNGVGEIEMANLYYFSWAAIITAGLQMMSYAKEAFRLKSEEYMLVVWAAISKVCFVMLGAAGHIWHTISDQCDIQIQNSAITYCSRTVLAMIVACTGIVLGCSVCFIRVVVPTRCLSTRSRAHCEAMTSIFLVLLFGVATGMVTGIGGPGQSVGDLYYSTWLAFWVSIGIFVSCYDQITLEEMEQDSLEESSRMGSTRDDAHVNGVLT